MADLTTVDKVREWLKVSGAADDALLTRLVTAVSSAVEEYVSRSLKSASQTETRDGPGGTRLVMRNYPITAIASLSIDGTSIPAAANALANGYVFNGSLIALRGYTFTKGVQNITVQYTAGYASLPADIEQALIDWLGHLYRARDRIGHQSKSINGETVSFFIGPMPHGVKLLLSPYRRVASC